MLVDKLFRGGVVMQVYLASIPFSWMCSNTLLPAPPSPTKCTGLVAPVLPATLPWGKRLGNIAIAPHVVSPFMASRLFIAVWVFVYNTKIGGECDKRWRDGWVLNELICKFIVIYYGLHLGIMNT